MLDFSSGDAIIRLVDPDPSAVITLTNPLTGESARAIVARTASSSKEEKKDEEQKE
jgi:hypothetical protein